MLLADQPIPVYTDLSTLYGSLGSSLNHAERWDTLVREFTHRFGRPPTYIARAPGRVKFVFFFLFGNISPSLTYFNSVLLVYPLSTIVLPIGKLHTFDQINQVNTSITPSLGFYQPQSNAIS